MNNRTHLRRLVCHDASLFLYYKRRFTGIKHPLSLFRYRLMSKPINYLNQANNPVVSIINGVDHDIKRIEGILMLGYVLVLLSPLLAPITPPHILLPLMALCFFCSVCCARFNFYNIHRKVYFSTSDLEQRHIATLQPVIDIFNTLPAKGLNEGFNPLKNLARTVKSALGAWLINP
ncbi:MAG: hypothetical protein ACKN9F_00300, partial [Methylomonas sp.]